MATTRSGIYLPPSVEKSGLDLREAYRCVVPGCGKRFHEEERSAYEAHVAKCAQQHHAEIVAMSPRTQAPGIYGDSGVDLEFEQHLKRKYGT